MSTTIWKWDASLSHTSETINYHTGIEYHPQCRLSNLLVKFNSKSHWFMITMWTCHIEAVFTIKQWVGCIIWFSIKSEIYNKPIASIITGGQVFIFLVVTNHNNIPQCPSEETDDPQYWKRTLCAVDIWRGEKTTVMQDIKAGAQAWLEIISGGSSGLLQWAASQESTSKTPR